jgi:uncharacterized protein
MVSHPKSAQTRKYQKLIIGPWPHFVNSTRQLAGVDFGKSALIDLRTLKLRWFDHWLKGVENGITNEPPVEIFVMGVNQWRKENEWPLERTRYEEYYFHSSGKANTSNGDGMLNTKRPSENEHADSFDYNPLHPCPNIYDEKFVAEGPFDQRSIEEREDVLVYTSQPLDRPLEVAGRIFAKIFCSTSAPDTDFWVQLVDVFPDGYSMHLTEGIIRGRYRESLEVPKLLSPEDVYEFNIDLWVTSNIFLEGHRLRIDVSSSSFPKYDRNPNTGHAFGLDAETIASHQKVFHEPQYSSCVTLPIIPDSRD